MPRNDIEVRANDIEKARPVDFRAHPVDFMSVCSAYALLVTLGVNHDVSERYGITAAFRSAIYDQKVAFRNEKTPENTVLARPQF